MTSATTRWSAGSPGPGAPSRSSPRRSGPPDEELQESRALAAREDRERGLRGDVDLPGAGRAAHLATASSRALRLGRRARARRRDTASRKGDRLADPLLQLARLARSRCSARRRRAASAWGSTAGGRPRRSSTASPTRAAASSWSTSACGRASSRCSDGSTRSRRSSTSATSAPRGTRADRRAARAPRRRCPTIADRRGRPVRDPLHVGHHGPLEGLHHHPPRHDRAGDRASCSRTLVGALIGGAHAARRRPAPSRRACSPRRSSTSAGSTRACAPQITVGAKLVFSRGPLRPEQVMQLIERREDRDLGRDPDHAAPRGAPPEGARLRPLEPARDPLRRRADAARDDREGARGAADRAELRQRLRPHRDPRRRDRERRQGPARAQDLDRAAAPGARHRDRRRATARRCPTASSASS